MMMSTQQRNLYNEVTISARLDTSLDESLLMKKKITVSVLILFEQNILVKHRIVKRPSAIPDLAP